MVATCKQCDRQNHPECTGRRHSGENSPMCECDCEFAPSTATSTLDIYQRTDGRWAWRLTAPNGNIIAIDGGQGYENKGDCAHMAIAIIGGQYAPTTKVTDDINAAYAATHARLADDPEYQRLKAAADQEAQQTPNQYLHRNSFAFYIETHTPLFNG